MKDQNVAEKQNNNNGSSKTILLQGKYEAEKLIKK